MVLTVLLEVGHEVLLGREAVREEGRLHKLLKATLDSCCLHLEQVI